MKRISPHNLIKSFGYALQGIRDAFIDNQNLQIHVIIACIAIILAIILDINPFEMAILGIMILLVISAEMVNTSIEEMVNLITQEHRKEAKRAKDVAAGMVLLTAVGSAIVGFLIFLPHIFALLHWKF